MASRRYSYRDKRFRGIVAALAFYGVAGFTLDSDFADGWIRGDCGGKERWDVKTLADPASRHINLYNSTPTTIADIAAMDPDFNPRKEKDRHAMEEQVLTITCTITEVIKQEDEDLHLVLKDGRRTMVGEIVFPCCPDVEDGKRHALFERVFKQFHPFRDGRKWKDHTWQVTGVVFVDYKHGGGSGQKGMLTNCIELHPIIDIHPIDQP